ncbi:MAG: chromate transporter, partial [Bacillota bacterium]|nr:chromate transporter [Bacillota bacterium]
ETDQASEKKEVEVKLSKLFSLYFLIGAFTIGGGYAMIPFIRREIIEKRAWMKDQQFLDNLSIAQSLPGPIVVNLSLLTGYHLRGLKGGLFSLLGAIIPSFLIIIFIAVFLWQYQGNILVQAAFTGIRPVVLALIVSAVLKLGKNVFLGYRPLLLFFLFLAGLIIFNIHPIFIIISSAMIGILWSSGRE